MKICFSMVTTSRTGGSRVLFEVGDMLAGRGHQVVFTSLGLPYHEWFHFENDVKFLYPELKFSISFPVLGRVPLAGVVNYGFRLLKFPYETERFRILAQSIPKECDITVATFCFTAYAVHRANVGIGFYYIQHYEPLLFASDPYLHQKAKETYYLPLNWIVNSSWANMKLRNAVGREGPVAVPGVDTSVFFPREREKKRDVKVIVALGKRGKIKGLSYLFKALEIIHKESSFKLRLVLYGNEPHLAKLSPIPTEYVVKPSDEELAELYSMADVAVISSLYESSPLPPLEAMGCGTPVVTTRYGTEDYCFNELNSLVVPSQDSKSLAEAILRVLTNGDLAEKLREKGFRTANQLTWENTTKRVEKVFKQALCQEQ